MGDFLSIFGGIFKRHKPHSRVWGRHSPTRFTKGAKPQICGFWHRGRILLSVSRRLPLSGISVHRANGVGLSARCTRPFSLSPKIHLKGRQLPAERGLLQTFFCFCNAEKGNLATGGAEDFSFHSLHHRVLKFAKRDRQLFSGFIYLLRVTLRFCQMNNKKSSKSFSDLLLSLAAGGGWYSVLGLIGQSET